MSLYKSIGGYFELELKPGEFYHRDVLNLNTGRNCLELVLNDYRPSKIYLPKYSCDVLKEPIEKLGIEAEFYSIAPNFHPDLPSDFSLNDSELLLYTNYYGCLSEVVEKLVNQFKNNLIVDNAQAFFVEALDNLATFYSPRKFFGVPDGGMLKYKPRNEYQFERDNSLNRFSHLIKRIESGAEYGYSDFIQNDLSLVGQEVKLMSNLTEKLLTSIQYSEIKKQRQQNFYLLDVAFRGFNELQLNSKNLQSPLCYPLLVENGVEIKTHLIRNRIYVPTYWPQVLGPTGLTAFETHLIENLVCLPIDQRYDEVDMKHIVNVINNFGK